MEQVGYSLIDLNNNEVQSYAPAIKGQLVSIPSMIVLPNGDRVHGAVAGKVIGLNWRLVERWVEDEPPSPLHLPIGQIIRFDGTKIIVTVQYGDKPSVTVPLIVELPDAIDAATKRYVDEQIAILMTQFSKE